MNITIRESVSADFGSRITDRIEFAGYENPQHRVEIYMKKPGSSCLTEWITRPWFLMLRYTKFGFPDENGDSRVVWINKNSFKKRFEGKIENLLILTQHPIMQSCLKSMQDCTSEVLNFSFVHKVVTIQVPPAARPE